MRTEETDEQKKAYFEGICPCAGMSKPYPHTWWRVGYFPYVKAPDGRVCIAVIKEIKDDGRTWVVEGFQQTFEVTWKDVAPNGIGISLTGTPLPGSFT